MAETETKTKETKQMEKTTTKRLANLNGKMLKKAVSVTKTLTAGDDKATVELVGQMGGLVNEMTAVVNRYGNGTSLPQPVNCEGMPVKAEPIPTAVIAEKLDAETPSELDLHKVVRADGKVTAYFEPTEKDVADGGDVEAAKDAVVSAGMRVDAATLTNGNTAVAVDLMLTEPDGDPILDDGDGEEDEVDDGDVDEPATEVAVGECAVPTREKMLEVITLTVARAIDVVNRHVGDQDPSVRKLESAVGFKHDLRFLMKRRFEVGTKEHTQAKYLYGVIKNLEEMLAKGKYVAIQQVAAYKA